MFFILKASGIFPQIKKALYLFCGYTFYCIFSGKKHNETLKYKNNRKKDCHQDFIRIGYCKRDNFSIFYRNAFRNNLSKYQNKKGYGSSCKRNCKTLFYLRILCECKRYLCCERCSIDIYEIIPNEYSDKKLVTF